MVFVSVEDNTQPLTSPVVGIFARPQLSPAPPGYIGEINDNDSRITDYLNKVQ